MARRPYSGADLLMPDINRLFKTKSTKLVLGVVYLFALSFPNTKSHCLVTGTRVLPRVCIYVEWNGLRLELATYHLSRCANDIYFDVTELNNENKNTMKNCNILAHTCVVIYHCVQMNNCYACYTQLLALLICMGKRSIHAHFSYPTADCFITQRACVITWNILAIFTCHIKGRSG